MPLFLIRFAASLVGERFAKAAVWAALIVLAAAALWFAKGAYDRDVIKDNSAAVETRATKADAISADQRAVDLVTVETAKGNRDAEIAKAPDAAPSDARMRLNCERLRRDGRTHAACRGFAGHPEAGPAR